MAKFSTGVRVEEQVVLGLDERVVLEELFAQMVAAGEFAEAELEAGEVAPGPGADSEDAPGPGAGSADVPGAGAEDVPGPGAGAGVGAGASGRVGLVAALAGVEDAVGQAGAAAAGVVGVFEPDLVESVEAVGRVRLALDGVGFALAREAQGRGLPTAVGLSLVDWLRVRCPWLCRQEAVDVAVVVRAGAQHWGEPFVEAAVRGATGMDRLARVGRVMRRVVGSLDPDLAGEYARIVVGAATNPAISDKNLALVCEKLLMDLLDEEPKERAKETAREMRCVRRRRLGQGMTRFTIDAPASDAALIDGVLNGPLAAPGPDKDGVHDSRMVGQRKYDALLAVLNRGLANPGAPPSSGRASVIVTIKADPGTGEPTGVGATGTGQFFDAAQTGRFACIGDVTPVWLDEFGGPVALGRTVRLATPGQFKALLVRDEHCSYPGCSMPPAWCDAHHLVWWSRGGGTDIENLALLCPRHHTLVHDKDLKATVTGSTVTWHL